MADVLSPEQLEAALDAIAPVSGSDEAGFRAQRERITASHETLREEVLAARDLMAMLQGWLRKQAER